MASLLVLQEPKTITLTPYKNHLSNGNITIDFNKAIFEYEVLTYYHADETLRLRRLSEATNRQTKLADKTWRTRCSNTD